MILFNFKESYDGFEVVSSNGNVRYQCKNRMKAAALEEAKNFCSSFQGACVVDTTYRLLRSFKYSSSLPTLQATKTQLELEQSGDIRLRVLEYYLDRTVYYVEVWGKEDKNILDNVWRAM